jgi:hypothetical protein
MISSSHKPLPDNTQHSQETDILFAGGIRTHNPASERIRPPWTARLLGLMKIEKYK